MTPGDIGRAINLKDTSLLGQVTFRNETPDAGKSEAGKSEAGKSEAVKANDAT